MANTDLVRGLKYSHNVAGTAALPLKKCFIPSTDGTAVFLGDLVKPAGSASSTQIDCQTVAQAAAGDALLLGVVEGVDQTDEVAVGSMNLYRKHRPASTAMYVLVRDDPNAVYEIQEDSVGGALTADEVGENADIVVAAGNATTGFSGMELDSSDHKTATAQLRILGFVPRADNEIGTNAKLYVMINEHSYKSTTGV
jgi:hypothetical protein